MGVPQAVQLGYNEALSLVHVVGAVVGTTVQEWASKHDYLFKERIKTAVSTAEKLESGRFRSWKVIDDLYACTVVVPTASHIGAVLQFLQAAFQTYEVRGQGIAKKSPAIFRFDSSRFIGLLREQPGSERPAGTERVLFEVQILTAFEYAWAVATHDLVFKGGAVDWRRDRLAAHLRAATEEADILISSFEATAGAIRLSPDAGTERRQRIVSFFQQALRDGKFAKSLEPSSWTRFGENAVSLVESYRPKRADEMIGTVLDKASLVLDQEGFPTSGSLFQAFVGLVAQTHGEKALRHFTIVDSAELRDFYGLQSVPKRFAFTGYSRQD